MGHDHPRTWTRYHELARWTEAPEMRGRDVSDPRFAAQTRPLLLGKLRPVSAVDGRFPRPSTRSRRPRMGRSRGGGADVRAGMPALPGPPAGKARVRAALWRTTRARLLFLPQLSPKL